MLIYVKDCFPDIDISELPEAVIGKDRKVKMSQQYLLPLEQCLTTKMYMHSIPSCTIVAQIYSQSDTQMGCIIWHWAPCWEKAGEFLSVLPILDWYFEKELPDEYLECHLSEVAALLDGKDFLLHVRRKDDFPQHTQHSSKMKAAGAHGINWGTGTGLSFEHTKHSGARITETRLVHLWGSLGIIEAPIKEWKDWAKKPENAESLSMPLCLKLATDEIDFRSAASLASYDPDSPENLDDDYDSCKDEDDCCSIESGILEVLEVLTPEEQEQFDKLSGQSGKDVKDQAHFYP